jgi:hypothetical protein
MSVRKLVMAVTLVVATAVAGPRPGVALVVYEDWSGGLIRADRWRGAQNFGGQEVKRVVTSEGELLLRYRRQGARASNTGSASSGLSLQFARSADVHEVEATFTVDSVEITACAANNAGSATRARPARLVMQKFNDGSSSGPGDQTGDHQALAQAFRNGSSTDPAGVLTVEAGIIRCTSASCGTFTSVVNQPLGTVAVGQTFSLRLRWDEAGDQFLASLDGAAEVTLPYGVPDSAPAANLFVLTNAFHTTANCTAGAIEVDSTTRIGPVSTNDTAVIP